eukprot:UC4_evm1s1314
MDKYLDYAIGRNLSNRMPLFVKPDKKVSLNDTMWAMRTHFESTWFDNRGEIRPDVGAGAENSPYRWRPLVWKFEGKSYVNERTVGTQQTAWNFVAQMRSNLPNEIGGLFWFAPDDSSTAIRTPVYASATRIPSSYADPVGQTPEHAVPYGVKADILTPSLNSAFWIYNLVANMCYYRYKYAFPTVTSKIIEYEKNLFASVDDMDKKALSMVKTDKVATIEMLTSFGETTGDQLVRDWLQFRDGFINREPTIKKCEGDEKAGCTFRTVSNSEETGYEEEWYGRIVKENAAKYEIPEKHKMNNRKLKFV